MGKLFDEVAGDRIVARCPRLFAREFADVRPRCAVARTSPIDAFLSHLEVGPNAAVISDSRVVDHQSAVASGESAVGRPTHTRLARKRVDLLDEPLYS